MSTVLSFEELKRRVELTSRARYHAARRLNAHGIFSQWTLAFLAIGQIVISLIPSLGIKTNFTSEYINFMNVFFAVLVLAYSLLLGMGNHVARSIKLHLCGLELGKLARELHLLCCSQATNNNVYLEKNSAYYSILEKCENHTRADYLVARLEQYAMEEKLSNGFGAWFKRQLYRAQMCFWHIIQFFHYISSIALISLWIFFLIKHP